MSHIYMSSLSPLLFSTRPRSASISSSHSPTSLTASASISSTRRRSSSTASSVRIALDRNKTISYRRDDVIARVVIRSGGPGQNQENANATHYVLSFRNFPTCSPDNGINTTSGIVLEDMTVSGEAIHGLLALRTSNGKPEKISVSYSVNDWKTKSYVWAQRTTEHRPTAKQGSGWGVYGFVLPCGNGTAFAEEIATLLAEILSTQNTRIKTTITFQAEHDGLKLDWEIQTTVARVAAPSDASLQSLYDLSEKAPLTPLSSSSPSTPKTASPRPSTLSDSSASTTERTETKPPQPKHQTFFTTGVSSPMSQRKSSLQPRRRKMASNLDSSKESSDNVPVVASYYGGYSSGVLTTGLAAGRLR